jgi:hypothetical protein
MWGAGDEVLPLAGVDLGELGAINHGLPLLELLRNSNLSREDAWRGSSPKMNIRCAVN